MAKSTARGRGTSSRAGVQIGKSQSGDVGQSQRRRGYVSRSCCFPHSDRAITVNQILSTAAPEWRDLGKGPIQNLRLRFCKGFIEPFLMFRDDERRGSRHNLCLSGERGGE